LRALFRKSRGTTSASSCDAVQRHPTMPSMADVQNSPEPKLFECCSVPKGTGTKPHEDACLLGMLNRKVKRAKSSHPRNPDQDHVSTSCGWLAAQCLRIHDLSWPLRPLRPISDLRMNPRQLHSDHIC
jgi:hypothetical protein